jgi:hypothetical protein
METVRTIKRDHTHNKQPGVLAEMQFIGQLFEAA